MIKKGGKDGADQQHWTLYAPEEAIMFGLEVSIIARKSGLRIGDGTIPWSELEDARKEAAQ